MKDDYKELRKNLKDTYVSKYTDEGYGLISGVSNWFSQCGIEPSESKMKIVFKIYGGIPYAYQQKDRLFIVEYLKQNKYKDYKNDKTLHS